MFKTLPVSPTSNIKRDLLIWIRDYLSFRTHLLSEYNNLPMCSLFEDALSSLEVVDDFESLSSLVQVIAQQKGLSSIRSYFYALNKLYKIAGASSCLSLKDISAKDMDKIYSEIRTSHTKKTAEAYLIQVESFFRYVERNNSDGHVFTFPKEKKKEIHNNVHFSEDEIKRFLSSLNTFLFRVENSSKPKLIVKLILFGGLTGQEIINIRKQDVSVVENPTSLLFGKFLKVNINGTKERDVYIYYGLVSDEFESYSGDPGVNNSKFYFTTETKKKYSANAIYKNVDRLLSHASIEDSDSRVHNLRKSYLHFLTKRCIDISVLFQLFGEISDEETSYYISSGISGDRDITEAKITLLDIS